ncbi:MAG TPA: argininosuccinate lyase [Candidatus Methylomirabilis sp.]|nr:argininosuccinate lyase [Candidatus Methylomirabilis sp.]
MKDPGHPPEPSSTSSEPFPAPVYAETVLAVNFEDAKKHFLEALLEIHAAHALMLARQRIIPRAVASGLLEAISKLDHRAILAQRYDGRSEDLFFYIQHLLSQSCGEDAAGWIHTARSRNDIDLTLYRMCLRQQILRIAADTADVRAVLLDVAAAHLQTIMPAYTHTQPAQPTTLAHYFLAAVEFLGRDIQRLRAAFATVNRNPLGACAITTTGFPIDRDYTARLLGFEGLQLNSYGAIGAIDYLTEAAAAIAVLMLNLGKLVQDLLMWCMPEFGFLRLSDAFVQASSIMPQKRNPVALEHVRILASRAFGQSQAALSCAHNTPFGDVVDSEDDLQPLAFALCADASRALRLFAGVVTHAEIDGERMCRAAHGSFLTVTELADTLVREEGLSFGMAHRLVSAAVRAVARDDSPESLVTQMERLAPKIAGRKLSKPREVWLRALDPVQFIGIRAIPGGPAPEAVRTQIASARKEQAEAQEWLNAKRSLLARYPQLIQAETLALKNSSH